VSEKGLFTPARLEGEDGTVTEAAFFGPPHARRFGVVHLPAEPARAGVVICSPLGAELLRNNRREVVVSRLLARSGIAVHRFHYHGAGNSDGQRADMTVSSMIEDAELAVVHLRERSGAGRIGFLGTRLGSMPAAAASSRHNAPLALWEPVASGQRYFRELLRALLMVEMGKAQEGAPTVTSKDLVAQLEATGTLDVAGFSIDLPLYEDAANRELADLFTGTGRDALIVQMARSDKLKAPLQKLTEKWVGDGHRVVQELVDHEEAWWFHINLFRSEEERDYAKQMFDRTVGFFTDVLDTGGSA
jgi:alpha/beta superfamily hydrolase